MGDDADPFDVFDESDGEREETTKEAQILRDPENGVLMFHGGTEKALLVFVKNNLSREQLALPPSDKLVLLIDLIDRFCYERHWMMNIGPEKGKTLEQFLGECLEANRAKTSDPFTFVELGTYCGYSCLRFLHRILQMREVGQFHIFTVDIEIERIQIAKEFVEMAGLQDCVTFLQVSSARLSRDTQPLSGLLLNAMRERLKSQTEAVPQIDFLFIDHEKTEYLSDFKELHLNYFIQKGTFVAADNVLFHGIDDYRSYIRNLVKEGVVTSRLVEGSLEYVNELTLEQERHLSKVRDGIELTVFHKSPSLD
ncbi:catechol O-methyltransferase [Fistulifera solaris]|uniref:catechol O-methyltransferase n=1 Tax=Fistulifera solaris TaxID=1519565 RepID=A0A1Z5J821_FISSO|nr:catechol O-methyltransferase [Fistulifera solaris]|eukprot:GAX10143.1 catechol O-methyltransferase [Fistulifera solaris]